MNNRQIGIFTAALFFISAHLNTAKATEDPLFRIVKIDDGTGLEIGRGYDILTGTPRSDCVRRAAVETHPNFGPNSVSFRSIRVENAAQLDRALGISASASVNTGYGSGQASASFANSLSVNSYSLYYVVQATVTSKGDSIRSVNLESKYLNMVRGKTAAIEKFRTICGDGYIGEFGMGGEFRAVIEIQTHSKAQSESVSASVSATLSMASGAAAFSTSLKTLAQNNEVRIWSFQRGGSGAIPVTPEEIAAKASSLPDLVKQYPTPIQMGIFSYIPLFDDPAIPMADFKKREIAISYLSDLSRRIRDQQADAQYILDHPTEFYSSPTDLPRLAGELKALEEFRGIITTRAEACVASSGNCKTIAVPVPTPSARPARR